MEGCAELSDGLVEVAGEQFAIVGGDVDLFAADDGFNALFFEEVEQVGEERGITPVGYFGARVTIGEFVTQVGDPDVPEVGGGLEEGGLKRQYAGSIGACALGEEGDELAGCECLLHGVDDVTYGVASGAFDPDCAGHIDELANDGPVEDVFFGDEGHGALGAEGEDIEVAQVIPDE
jgi:hypothetical protein